MSSRPNERDEHKRAYEQERKRDEPIWIRALDLICPDKHRRAECVLAVRVELLLTRGSAKDLQQHFERTRGPGKDAADRLHKALQDLRTAIRDPELADDLRQLISPENDLVHVIKRVDAARKTGRRFYYKAQKKLVAAEAAYRLLQQFTPEPISAVKGRRFCKLAALLYGEPRSDLQWTCRLVVDKEKAKNANG